MKVEESLRTLWLLWSTTAPLSLGLLGLLHLWPLGDEIDGMLTSEPLDGRHFDDEACRLARRIAWYGEGGNLLALPRVV